MVCARKPLKIRGVSCRQALNYSQSIVKERVTCKVFGIEELQAGIVSTSEFLCPATSRCGLHNAIVRVLL